MTPRTKLLIEHVEDSIAKALRHESHIDVEILALSGFSTGVMRRLVSNLCQLPTENPAYLEVGLYAGATFCAALNNNPKLRAVGIENRSQPFGRADIFQQLDDNLARYIPHAKAVKIIDADCFSEEARLAVQSEAPFDAMFYDGHHDRVFQAHALPHFIDAMAKEFIFIVDDYNWDASSLGTQDGFEALRDIVRVDEFRKLVGDKLQDDPVWWNGVALFVCSKI